MVPSGTCTWLPQTMLSNPLGCGISSGQWLNSLWPSDTISIWQDRSGSTLAQKMACALLAPSHYIWLYVNSSPEVFCGIQLRAISQEVLMENYLSQCWPSSMSPYGVTRPQWVKMINTSPSESIIRAVYTYTFVCHSLPNTVSYAFHSIQGGNGPKLEV